MNRPMIRSAVLAALTSAVAMTALPVQAQTSAPFEMPKADAAPPAADDPFRFPPRERSAGERSPMDELLDNMLRRAQPHLEDLARDMGGLMNEYAPVFEELSGLMDDIENYQLPPERLPNGDILIRRKAGAPPPPPLEQLPNFLPKGDAAPGTAPAQPQPLPQPQPGKPLVTPPGGGQVEL